MASKNNWNADGMKGTLISDMEKEVREGVSQVAAGNQTVDVNGKPSGSQPTGGQSSDVLPSDGHGNGQQAAGRTQQKPTANPDDLVEPTKGVQTYLTVTRYRQLSDIKLKRGKGATIGSLAAEAICDWLDRQQAAATTERKA